MLTWCRKKKEGIIFLQESPSKTENEKQNGKMTGWQHAFVPQQPQLFWDRNFND